MKLAVAVRLSSAAQTAPALLPTAGGSLRRAGRPSSEGKEAGRVVGARCSGGPPANNGRVRGLAPANATAFQALSQPSTVSSPHPRRKGLPHLAEDLARCDGSLRGLQPPAAGGGLSRVSPARILISQNEVAASVQRADG